MYRKPSVWVPVLICALWATRAASALKDFSKGRKGQRVVCAMLLLSALSAAPVASAANRFSVYATSTRDFRGEDGKRLPSAVRWWYSDREQAYVFFLPSDAGTLYLWFEGADRVEVDGQEVTHGEEAAYLLDGDMHALKVGIRTHPFRVMRSANTPAMFISTSSGSLDYIHWRKGNWEPGALYMTGLDGSLIYDGQLTQVRGRGNSTFTLRKKPYQIKLEKGTDLCSMGKSKTWVLLADFRDNSLLRNKATFSLAQAVGIAYTPLSTTVDLYINNDYMGAYLLCEKVEIGKTRVDIADLSKATQALNDAPLDSYERFGRNGYKAGVSKGYAIPNDPEDITGGYLLEMDYKMRYKNETSGFVTRQGQAVTIKEPKAASEKQVQYISSFFQGFEDAIRSSDGRDPATGKHYSEFVDMDSLVKKYLLEEILKNRDANRSSLYFYKPADGESQMAFMGPPWDYDVILGNHSAREGDRVALPVYFNVNNDSGENFYVFPALYQHVDFREAVVAAYHRDFVPALRVLLGQKEDASGRLKSLQGYADDMWDCAAMNFVRWPVFNIKARSVRTGADYQENIDFLVDFLEKRMVFLEEEWPSPSTELRWDVEPEED